MSSKRIRTLLRYGHLVEGALIGIYIYSPLGAVTAYALFIQFVIFPLVIFSGIAMWQLPRYNKWRSQRRKVAQGV